MFIPRPYLCKLAAIALATISLHTTGQPTTPDQASPWVWPDDIRTLFEQKQYDQAIDEAERLLPTLDLSQRNKALAELADGAFLLKRYDKAVELYRRLLPDKPTTAVHCRLIETLLRAGRLTEARQSLDAAYQQLERPVELQCVEAALLHKESRHDDAKALALDLREQFPGSWQVWVTSSQLVHADDPDLEREYICRSFEAGNPNLSTWGDLSRNAINRRDWPLIARLSACPVADQNLPPTFYAWLAVANYQQGNLQASLEWWGADAVTRQEEPQKAAIAYNNMALIEAWYTHEPQLALVHAHMAMQHLPTVPQVRDTYAAALLVNGQIAEAKEVITALIKERGPDEHLAVIGELAVAEGKPKVAIQLWLKQLQKIGSPPADPPLQQRLIQRLETLGVRADPAAADNLLHQVPDEKLE